MSTNTGSKRGLIGLALGAAVAVFLLLACYSPGLQGDFLFDDAANLPALGAFGPVDNASALMRYVTSGRADPTGRPVALLSFLIDAHDWPAQPLAFKRTNLIIHLTNATLLSVVLFLMGVQLGMRRRASYAAAVLAATFWALNPFFVSTVLYIVQREAMLPATFTLLGMLAWLQARRITNARASNLWIGLGIGGCTVFATLSKANGLMLPLLILVSEAVLPVPTDPRFRRRLWLALGPLSTIVIVYLTWSALSSIGQGAIAIRGWSVGQRLLTEPSILLDYLAQLWLVKPTDSTLLHDDIAVATSLWAPWYTVPALLGCIGAVALAWIGRRRWPALSLAVLFFFAGHLMESTSLALELYFDHRNYLPAMPMFWPLAIAITGWRTRSLSIAGAVAGVLAVSLLTASNATLWGNPLAQSVHWAAQHPESARAQAYAAQMLATNNRQEAAISTIDAANERFRGQPQIAVNAIDLHCLSGTVSNRDLIFAQEAFATANREPGPLLLNWFASAINMAHSDTCANLTRDALVRILDAAASNPRIDAVAGRRQDVMHVRGAIALAWDDPDTALDWFNKALAQLPTPQAALNQAAALGSAGYPQQGLRHLQYFSSFAPKQAHNWRDGMPWIHDQILEHDHYWQNELDHLQAALQRAAPVTVPKQ